jgi:predicted choloylglycine hydrolase
VAVDPAQSVARASGVDRNLLVLVDTLFDMQKLWGCSALMIEPERSATHAPLFGRNLDFPPFGRVHENSLVTVYRPRGKYGLPSIGFPGLHGCASGMNEKGLAIAWLDVYSVRDGSPAFDPAGIPLVSCFRRVLEECATLEEAEKLVRSLRRTRSANLAVCDRQRESLPRMSSCVVRTRVFAHVRTIFAPRFWRRTSNVRVT